MSLLDTSVACAVLWRTSGHNEHMLTVISDRETANRKEMSADTGKI